MSGIFLRAIGLMSGTSLDGIDAALIESDGERIAAFGPSLTLPYETDLRDRLRGLLGRDCRGDVAAEPVVRAMTEAHADAVRALLSAGGLAPGDIDVVGFHGQTVFHRPEHGVTVQIGDGGLLARLTGIPVVDDFRSRDVAEGGQGAPLAPLFHAAVAMAWEKPVAVLNIGGVGNVTWIGPRRDEIVAFDTGPGNALLDDWTLRHTGQTMDAGGALARTGTIDESWLATALRHPYFARNAPKSLDRDEFRDLVPDHLSASDGAASLVALTAATVARAQDHLPGIAKRWLVCGGGRHNPAIMDELRKRLGASIEPIERVGLAGDDIEAQAFAFLAVRSVRGLPLSLPSTTGVRRPATGGVLHPVSNRKPLPAD